MTYSGLDKNGVLVANHTVINGEEDQCPSLKPHYRDLLERFIVLEAKQRVGINEIEILALKTKHSEQAIGFKFFTPYFTLSYSSDTKYFPELIEEYKNSNILILNVPHLKKEDAKDNLCIEDAIKIIKEVSPRLAIIQHFGIEILKGDPMYQIREIQKATGVQTIAAKDGMVINPLSYSVEQGQRTLLYPKEKRVDIREEPVQEVKEVIEENHQSIIETENNEQKQEVIEEEQPSIKELNEEPITQEQQIKEIIKENQEQPKENILESNEPLKDVLRDNS